MDLEKAKVCYEKYAPIEDKLLGLNYGYVARECWVMLRYAILGSNIPSVSPITTEQTKIAFDGKYGSIPRELVEVIVY